MDWLSWLEKKQGGTGGTRKYWLYADGKTSKEAGWHNQIHDDDSDEMERGSAKITHDHDGNEGYFGVTLRNHLSDSQRSHINQQIKENRYHQFPKNISFDHGHNNNDTVNSSKKYYPKNQHIAEPKDDDYKNAAWEAWLEKEDKEIKKKPTMFPRIRREFEDEKDEDPMVYDNKTASWESWLEKEEKPKERDYLAEMQTQGEQNMYQNSSKKKKFLKEAKGAGKKIEQQMGENDLPLSYSNRLRTNIKRPAERVTGNDLSDLDGWVEENKSWETWLEKTQQSTIPKRVEGGLKNDIDGTDVEGVLMGAIEQGDIKARSGIRSKHPYKNRDIGSRSIVQGTGSSNNVEDKDDDYVTNSELSNDKSRVGGERGEGYQNALTLSHRNAKLLKTWESWLEKNNATETSHKKDEKKEEWDGKFSSSTIRDDVKDDDDKAVSEEESLEELTDGKLEEVEKLKSWELWLEKDALNPDSKDKPRLMNTQRFARISTEVRGGNAQGGKLGDASLRGMRAEEKKRGKKYKWKNPRKGRVGVESSTETPPNKKLYHGTERQAGNYPALGTDSGKKSGEKFAQLFQEKKSWESWLEKGRRVTGEVIGWGGKTPSESTHLPAEGNRGGIGLDSNQSKEDVARQARDKVPTRNAPKWVEDKAENQYDRNDIMDELMGDIRLRKSWELWLNKYEETAEDKKLALQLDEARAVTGKKVATQKVKPETGEDAKMGEYSTITAEKFKSWTTWLEKMQGAGDARFGNQHLTGLDQKPVDNEEDEANILPEKEEKTDDKEEKQEKTEDKEDKDNKPYKALSQE